MHAIVASIDSENAPSIALFERFGYVEAARLTEVGRKFERWRTQLLLLKGFGRTPAHSGARTDRCGIQSEAARLGVPYWVRAVHADPWTAWARTHCSQSGKCGRDLRRAPRRQEDG